jgi:ABC-2 type transport system permease protein
MNDSGASTLPGYFTCLRGVLWRESLRFFQQRERFAAALVRPLI